MARALTLRRRSADAPDSSVTFGVSIVSRCLDGSEHRAGRLARRLVLDDDADTEILPVSMAGWCRDQFARIEAHAAGNENVLDAGWNEARVRAALVVMTPLPSAVAFGPSPLSGVSLVADATGKLIWIDVALRRFGVEAEAVLAALATLPSPEPLVLVDWAQARIVDLRSVDETRIYSAR